MNALIVEDEHKIAGAVRDGLRAAGFVTEIYYDGESGLAAAGGSNYDVIILDRMLPGAIDGLAFCNALRKSGNHTPIIMLTAKDHVQDRIDGLNSGADDYVVKPFSFQELLARVRAVLRRPHDALGETLQAGDLTLNTYTKHVERGGVPIHLSATEFALLEYLLRNKGKIVSKNVLMNHVWDFDATILPSTVEVFIVYVRAKIEKPFSGPKLIRTVRGFGYVIGDPV